jgi:phospholipid/cholesterol/gamma-HCH transport system substrate-binding protein
MAFGRKKSSKPRLRKDRTGMGTVKAGLLLIGFVVLVSYFGFSKDIPFTHGFRVKVVVPSANSIRKNSPVRIAGVNVGKVKSIKAYSKGGKTTTAAVVELEIQKVGLPIHKDATIRIRPRIFLEGNFFVDLSPGTPSAPIMKSGGTIPITNVSDPTQLDQVLTALQTDTRKNLQVVLDQLGTALNGKPDLLDNLDADPSTKGQTAAESFNDTYNYSPTALRDTSIVNEASLGTQPHDLSKLVASFGKVAGALDRNESSLEDLITNFNTTTGAFAAESGNLKDTIRLLDPTLRTTNRALTSLNNAFPPTRAFAREILPGVRATPATIAASFPWIRQVRALLSQNELRGLSEDLRPTTANLARLTDQTDKLLPQADLIAKCVNNVILPTGNVVINEPGLNTGERNYKEFWYTMVGLAGEGQNFDGNGHYVRFQPGGGTQSIATGNSNLTGESLFGNASAKPLGTRPKYTQKRPPVVSSVPCYKSKIPDLNGPAANAGAAAASVRTVNSNTPQAAALPANADSGDGIAEQLVRRLNPFSGAAASRGISGSSGTTGSTGSTGAAGVTGATGIGSFSASPGTTP